ncbi:MAG: type II secretion system F family protein [Parafannyhessea sp.]|uniref:type II secretion system F family protein n=1 Tax=Parafannyhessea sp. TaxID=2847324 RepID=UPI003F00BC76
MALLGSGAMASASTFALAFVLVSGGSGGGGEKGEGSLSSLAGSIERRLRSMGPVAELERRGRESARKSTCLRDLPSLLDVVTLGLSSGLSFDAALDLYCERYDNELSSAFSEAMLSWQVGAESRAEALGRLATELDVDALRSFASTVTQALEFGSPLASALEAQAEAIREEQRSQLEEEIEKVPVKMLVPLGTLIVPAMLISILGPLLGSSLTLS